MKKTSPFLSADEYQVMLSFLDFSDLHRLQSVSAFFKQNITLFLENGIAYKETHRILDVFMLLYYFKYLKSDFPTLNKKPQSVLPYLKKNRFSDPPIYTIFHRLFNFISAYPVESNDFSEFNRRFRMPKPIDLLRAITKNISNNAGLDIEYEPLNLEQISNLATDLHTYKKYLSLFLNQKNRSTAYTDALYFRRISLLLVAVMVSFLCIKSLLISENQNTNNKPVNFILLTSLGFIILDFLFVTACKKHLNTYYPGLILSQQFLEKRLALFDHFFKSNQSKQEIENTLKKTFSDHKETLIALEPTPENKREKMNLFFYYQHHYHPHACYHKATKNPLKERSIHAVNGLYGYFCNKEAEKKLKAYK